MFLWQINTVADFLSMLKTGVLPNIFVETMIYLFPYIQDSSMNRKLKRTAFI